MALPTHIMGGHTMGTDECMLARLARLGPHMLEMECRRCSHAGPLYGASGDP